MTLGELYLTMLLNKRRQRNGVFFQSSNGISSLVSHCSQIFLPKKKKIQPNLEQSKTVREDVNNCVVCRWQGVMPGTLCEESPELPHARRSWFHPAPANPLQDTGECLSQRNIRNIA